MKQFPQRVITDMPKGYVLIRPIQVEIEALHGDYDTHPYGIYRANPSGIVFVQMGIGSTPERATEDLRTKLLMEFERMSKVILEEPAKSYDVAHRFLAQLEHYISVNK